MGMQLYRADELLEILEYSKVFSELSEVNIYTGYIKLVEGKNRLKEDYPHITALIRSMEDSYIDWNSDEYVDVPLYGIVFMDDENMTSSISHSDNHDDIADSDEYRHGMGQIPALTMSFGNGYIITCDHRYEYLESVEWNISELEPALTWLVCKG